MWGRGALIGLLFGRCDRRCTIIVVGAQLYLQASYGQDAETEADQEEYCVAELFRHPGRHLWLILMPACAHVTGRPKAFWRCSAPIPVTKNVRLEEAGSGDRNRCGAARWRDGAAKYLQLISRIRLHPWVRRPDHPGMMDACLQGLPDMFELHPQLAADTVPVADWTLSRVLLINDATYPWLVPDAGTHWSAEFR